MKKLPKAGTIVLATLRHWHTKGEQTAILKRVEEGDCDWRVLDGGDELSYDWDVVSWAEMPRLKP